MDSFKLPTGEPPATAGTRFGLSGPVFVDRRARTAIDPWPRPRAWQQGRADPVWKPGEPEVRFDGYRELRRTLRAGFGDGDQGQGSGAEAEQEALDHLLSAMPEPVLDLLRTGGGQWRMLRTLATCRGALELGQRNLGLLCALSHADRLCFRPVFRQTIGRMCRAKHRDIAGWLCFPRRRASARVLRKMTDASLTLWNLTLLQGLLRDEGPAKILYHCPRINGGVIRILLPGRLGVRVRPALAYEIASLADEARSVSSVLLVSAIAERVQLLETRHPPVLSSLDQALVVHAELEERCRRAGVVGEGDRKVSGVAGTGPIPEPPLLGSGTIVPLRTRAAVLREGRAMKHCVVRYLPKVREGHLYLYRVLEPERATLAIRRHGEGWELAQLVGARNRTVQEETRRAVELWLQGTVPGAVPGAAR